jgi:hypothetical protein
MQNGQGDMNAVKEEEVYLDIIKDGKPNYSSRVKIRSNIACSGGDEER